MFEVRISDPAERDILADFVWWSERRSAEQALRWYEAIYPAIETLQDQPRRCPLADENDPSLEVRQLLFTIGRRPTHRIIFSIEGSTVFILRVRHVSQRRLSPDELRP